MPKQLKEDKGLVAKLEANTNAGGSHSKYPYEAWFTGKLLLIEMASAADKVFPAKGADGDYFEDGSDVTGQDGRDIMIAKLKAAAARKYLTFSVLTKKDAEGELFPNGGIAIKSRPMTEAERVENDKDRARTAAINAATSKARSAARKAGADKEGIKKAAREAAAKVRAEWGR